MPGPLVIPLIAAGATIAGSAINAASTGNMNKKNRKFALEQSYRARGWAEQDWAKQNEYNSPRAQMQRFQEAGLNKNLIYGQSNEAGAVRSSAPAEWKGEAPQIDAAAPSRVLSQYYQDRQTTAQTDLVAQQMSIAIADEQLKRA